MERSRKLYLMGVVIIIEFVFYTYSVCQVCSEIKLYFFHLHSYVPGSKLSKSDAFWLLTGGNYLNCHLETPGGRSISFKVPLRLDSSGKGMGRVFGRFQVQVPIGTKIYP